jgi:ABC-2 type transport system permease protein
MIVHMVKKEFRQLRRDRRMLPIVFLAPVILLLLLGYAANLDPQDIPVLLCDLDRTALSRELSREFYATGYFLPAGNSNNLDDIGDEMERRGASAALVIPQGFGADLSAGLIPQAPYLADGSDSTTTGIAMGYAQNIIRLYGIKAAGMNAGASSRIDIRTRILFNPALLSRNFMVPGLLAMVLMVITIILTSLAVVKEKELGTMEQLIVTPLRTVDILFGKLLPFALIGVVDVLLAIGASRLIFGLEIAGSSLLLFGLSLIFLLNTLGLGLLVSTFSNNQQQAMMASIFFVMLPMIILSGFIFPVENMPGPIRLLTHLLPLRYYFTIVRGIYLKGAGPAELWDEGLSLLLLGIVIFSISILRFRKRLE